MKETSHWPWSPSAGVDVVAPVNAIDVKKKKKKPMEMFKEDLLS